MTPWFEVYVGLEEEACEIRSYEAEAIPGLLQTEGYARAVMLADVDVPADEEIQRRIAVRMKRQERLTGEDAGGCEACDCCFSFTGSRRAWGEFSRTLSSSIGAVLHPQVLCHFPDHSCGEHPDAFVS